VVDVRRFVALCFVSLFIVLLTAAAVGAGDGGHRVPTGADAEMLDPQLPPQVVRAQQGLDRLGGMAVNCSTMKCVNKALNQQAKAIGTLQEDMDEVWGIFGTCLAFMPVTEYGDESQGYLWWTETDPEFYYVTTALDVSWEGDPVTAWTWVWDMEACPL
jgi:hypothetical protein